MCFITNVIEIKMVVYLIALELVTSRHFVDMKAHFYQRHNVSSLVNVTIRMIVATFK